MLAAADTRGTTGDVRSRKYRVITTMERGSNRLIRAALRVGLAPRAFALLETSTARPRPHQVEKWGADLYGNPCRDCGFAWNLSPAEAVASVQAIPKSFAKHLAAATGRERHPDLAWTTTAYVSHVTDNLRTWAERLAGAYLAGDVTVAGYDPDLLSQARHYNEISLAGALWSLNQAVDAWAQSVETALTHGVVLQHETRGPQRAEDVARNNAHDAHHHLWDIDRTLRADRTAPS